MITKEEAKKLQTLVNAISTGEDLVNRAVHGWTNFSHEEAHQKLSDARKAFKAFVTSITEKQ